MIDDVSNSDPEKEQGRLEQHQLESDLTWRYLDQYLPPHTRSVLEQQQWTILVNEASPVPPKASLLELWKMYANGVAVTLSIQEEAGQFVVYEAVGHAMTGSNRTESGRFSTLNPALQQLIQVCYQWDSTWET